MLEHHGSRLITEGQLHVERIDRYIIVHVHLALKGEIEKELTYGGYLLHFAQTNSPGIKPSYSHPDFGEQHSSSGWSHDRWEGSEFM